MYYAVLSNIIASPWIPGIINPERRGHYERNRIERTPGPREYWAPEDWDRFMAAYPAPPNITPPLSSVLFLEYWDGTKWWLTTETGSIHSESYVGPGKEKHYWRGIEYDDGIHARLSRPADLSAGWVFDWGNPHGFKLAGK